MPILKNFSVSLLATTSLLCAPAAVAHEVETTPEAEVEASTPVGPALWKVADEDTTIYLFGTVHALPEGVNWMNETIP